MPFAKDSTEETKKRIIEVVRRHFSEKGFDAARVDEIAKDAGVNKALIYYYFESKEAILDHLIQELFDDVSPLALEFVEEHVVSMISQGRLDIESDRWRFASEDDAMDFYRACLRYVEKIVDFSLSNRGVVRIAIFESLKHENPRTRSFSSWTVSTIRTRARYTGRSGAPTTTSTSRPKPSYSGSSLGFSRHSTWPPTLTPMSRQPDLVRAK